MKKLIGTVFLLNFTIAAVWFAWSEVSQKRELPQVRVSVPMAQALPSPREEQVTRHLENPRLSELTGYLEIIKASRLGSNDLSDAVYFYTVHTSAGPIRFQPVVRVEESLHALHGAMVHLRESEKGYHLLNKSDERKFAFELVKVPASKASGLEGTRVPEVIRILVTPNLNGVKTRMVLKTAAAKKLPFAKVVIGPDCLSPTGTQIFALLDQTLEGLDLSNRSHLLDFLVVAKEECLKAEYTSLGYMSYVTTGGLRDLQVRFRIWNGSFDVPNPETLEHKSSEEAHPLQITELTDAAGCGDLKISANLSPTKVDQKIVFRAHQVGDQMPHLCQAATNVLGTATCTVTGLNPSLPYLISAQRGDHYDFQIWNSKACIDPAKARLSFVRKMKNFRIDACDEGMPVALRTENILSGSQILISAEDELGHQETCLATVNESEGVGIAKCTIPRAQSGVNYTLLAMYDSARAWAFTQHCTKGQ